MGNMSVHCALLCFRSSLLSEQQKQLLLEQQQQLQQIFTSQNFTPVMTINVISGLFHHCSLNTARLR